MAFEQKPNEGALFKNDRRETEQHPNMRGSATIVCVHCGQRTELWVSAWTNTVRQGEREGQRYQSLKYTAKENQGAARPAAAREPEPAPIEDDDIPF